MRAFLGDKVIVLGVTGSIAAYKACEIASRLVEHGAQAIPVLSASAQQFVGAASFEGITGQRAITSMFEPAQNPDIEHIAVARRADAFLIAPATANILAKAAQGMADDWLSTTLLATRAPVVFAPAMNMNMYSHPAVQANIATLQSRGCAFVGPGSGQLACGDMGPGRLIETQAILEALAVALHHDKPLAGKRVLLTSGANHEPIDPVRYIGNRSSGKMGHAIALEAMRRGATVTVVSGPAEVPPPYGARVVPAHTASAMLEAVQAHWGESDIFIGAAAVADYHVENPPAAKQKRSTATVHLELTPNTDIAAWVGLNKRGHQIAVGFAAETHNHLEFAQEKLRKKQLDLVVANAVGVADSGFGKATTRAWLITDDHVSAALPLMSKEALAALLFDAIAGLPAGVSAAPRA
ncbi:MAG: bifunctional phosphopantothenoylcysteine decarboxylase/phosphopantothenate--cysteine ligase CoaBC [Candidatus Hydrogenedentes bacterium]|nr:bifunctional phosphopantothenoylcysteine decarboxylase/phosphopantothenate--cysteine ligase CoaBC [Candidatus Hydrogenedentota bacterium]